MCHFTHFEAFGHLFLLPLSSQQSSRSCRSRERLPPILYFHRLRKLFERIEPRTNHVECNVETRDTNH